VAAAVALLCGLPYLLAAAFGPPGLERLGTFWFGKDFSQYAAAMREGARQSGWLIHDHFSAEPHTPALMYPLYVAAGKVAALFGLSNVTVFATLEWLGRLAVFGAVYAFAAAFLEGRRQRRLAVILTLVSLGLDAWTLPLRLVLEGLGLQATANLLPDAINPYLEVSSFGVLLSAPHLMFGLALTLICAPLYLRAVEGKRVYLGLLGAGVLGLSLVHSFNTPVLVSVLVAHAAVTGRRAWPAALVAASAAAPMVLYSVALYSLDPFWSGTYGIQNLMPSPPVWGLPFDFGVVLLAAPLAWPIVRRWPAERRWLLALWIGLGLAWMYVPAAYQRRFAFGVHPALGVAAAVGLLELNAWLRARHVGWFGRRVVNYAVAIGTVSTSLLVYIALLASAVSNKPTEVYLWSYAEAAAAAWLGEHSTAEDVVLASTDFANPMVSTIDGRVVYGHSVASLDAKRKEAEVQRFYAASDDRSAILRESGATIVAVGPRERAMGAFDLSTDPGLNLIYANDGVELYRVLR
jgi:hypothetical protein